MASTGGTTTYIENINIVSESGPLDNAPRRHRLPSNVITPATMPYVIVVVENWNPSVKSSNTANAAIAIAIHNI